MNTDALERMHEELLDHADRQANTVLNLSMIREAIEASINKANMYNFDSDQYRSPIGPPSPLTAGRFSYLEF